MAPESTRNGVESKLVIGVRFVPVSGEMSMAKMLSVIPFACVFQSTFACNSLIAVNPMCSQHSVLWLECDSP